MNFGNVSNSVPISTELQRSSNRNTILSTERLMIILIIIGAVLICLVSIVLCIMCKNKRTKLSAKKTDIKSNPKNVNSIPSGSGISRPAPPPIYHNSQEIRPLKQQSSVALNSYIIRKQPGEIENDGKNNNSRPDRLRLPVNRYPIGKTVRMTPAKKNTRSKRELDAKNVAGNDGEASSGSNSSEIFRVYQDPTQN